MLYGDLQARSNADSEEKERLDSFLLASKSPDSFNSTFLSEDEETLPCQRLQQSSAVCIRDFKSADHRLHRGTPSRLRRFFLRPALWRRTFRRIRLCFSACVTPNTKCRPLPLTLGMLVMAMGTLWFISQALLLSLTTPPRMAMYKNEFIYAGTQQRHLLTPSPPFVPITETPAAGVSNTLWFKQRPNLPLFDNDTVRVRWKDAVPLALDDDVNATAASYAAVPYTPDELFQLTWNYLLEERDHPYVGSKRYMEQLFPTHRPFPQRDASWISSHTEKPQGSAQFSVHYYNALAVFSQQDASHLHGRLGLSSTTREPLYVPQRQVYTMPAERERDTDRSALAGDPGALSDTLGLERATEDHRHAFCVNQPSAASRLLEKQDASVIIAFHNERPSILLRTLHSVLNRTPPPVLREILLVDDVSTLPDLRPGSFLDRYVRTLPKVKLMRTAQRSGIGSARRQGMHLAQAPVVVFLDSDVEVNVEWLEPLLDALHDNPRSVVFPQVLAINAFDFGLEPSYGSGICRSRLITTFAALYATLFCCNRVRRFCSPDNAVCWSAVGHAVCVVPRSPFMVSAVRATACLHRIQWNMEDHAYPPLTSVNQLTMPSPAFPSAAFAIRRQWLRELGDFDLGVAYLANEHVELSLRVWQCGGSVQCAPCSIVYHMFRTSASHGLPSGAIEQNRNRTAELWTNAYHRIVNVFSTSVKPVLTALYDDNKNGGFNAVAAMKNRTQCHDFQWYIDRVGLETVPRRIQDLRALGPIVSETAAHMCLTVAERQSNSAVGLAPCSRGLSTQQFLVLRGETSMIYVAADTDLCLSDSLFLEPCDVVRQRGAWNVMLVEGSVRWHPASADTKALNMFTPKLQCLVAEKDPQRAESHLLNPYRLSLARCSTSGVSQRSWSLSPA